MVSSALRGNGTNPGRRGASPEGACRVEYRGAAIGHPKVLPGPAGVRCQGIRPSCRARTTVGREFWLGARCVADGGRTAGPRRRLGLVMVPRFGLAGVEPAHGDQAEPEVADYGQQPMQGGLVSEQPADDRLVALAADVEAV